MERRAFLPNVGGGFRRRRCRQDGARCPRKRTKRVSSIPVLANKYVVVYPPSRPMRNASTRIARDWRCCPVGVWLRRWIKAGSHPSIKMDADGRALRGKIYTSDDHGKTWTHRTDMPMMHARPFSAGNSVYVLGHNSDLCIIRSDDGGGTWSRPLLAHAGPALAPGSVQCPLLPGPRVPGYGARHGS